MIIQVNVDSVLLELKCRIGRMVCIWIGDCSDWPLGIFNLKALIPLSKLLIGFLYHILNFENFAGEIRLQCPQMYISLMR